MYTEAQQIIKQMEKHNFSTGPFKWTHDLRFLGVHPDTNRRVVPDMEQARAMMTLFFPSDFLDSNHGKAFKDSLLLKQAERASLGPPKIRSHTSTKFRPRSFWADWDDIQQKKDFELRKIPRYWDNTIRPIIAKLYREGVIGEAHVPYPPGQAIAATEPDRDPDLYFDFRVLENDITFPSSVEQNPPTKEKLILKAQSYAKDHPNARFALLRLWSAPHFYPLMLGLDRRSMISFSDIVGRAWEWKFIPKVRHPLSFYLTSHIDSFGGLEQLADLETGHALLRAQHPQSVSNAPPASPAPPRQKRFVQPGYVPRDGRRRS